VPGQKGARAWASGPCPLEAAGAALSCSEGARPTLAAPVHRWRPLSMTGLAVGRGSNEDSETSIQEMRTTSQGAHLTTL